MVVVSKTSRCFPGIWSIQSSFACRAGWNGAAFSCAVATPPLTKAAAARRVFNESRKDRRCGENFDSALICPSLVPVIINKRFRDIVDARGRGAFATVGHDRAARDYDIWRVTDRDSGPAQNAARDP